MENYLKQDAYYDTIGFTSSTNLVFLKNELVGFFTLKKQKLNIEVDISDADSSEIEELDYEYSLDIARLAVKKDCQDNGIGTKIISKIIDIAISANERFVTLDSLIEKVEWYTKRGFISMIEEESRVSNKEGLVYMFMDLYDDSIVEAYFEEEAS
ncbi:GNAT family N-acetyltransferase [Cytobacillus sp. FSL R5-0569]|uniref:GNAT family N-acetyltransferase n=1 Tax=Cytobacillus sp. FSL R5-0569 TaxID=2921649 RepID=UPI0030FA60CC